MKHITVLQDEAVNALQIADNSVVVDATLGAGGHGRAIIKRLGRQGVYIGLDVDPMAIAEATNHLTGLARIHLVCQNFSQLPTVIKKLKIKPVNAILADLGWRSEQFTTLGKGFSFNDTVGLLMTYGDPADQLFTATDIVNTWAEADIANVIYGYGEERYAKRIAQAIVRTRQKALFTNAWQLAELVSQVVPANYRRRKIHPATKTFQALRIAVNDELNVLKEFIAGAWSVLIPGGRLVIISFHSLEDRIVKQTFRTLASNQSGVLITKKPITPTAEEIHQNPRARSAKLRVIQKN